MLSGVMLDSTLNLVGKYGVNWSRFFVKPGLTLRLLALNSERPLFRNNPKLRRAVNFALDRSALLPNAGGPIAARPTDQLLPYVIPGFRDSTIYPLEGADLAKARELAGGRLQGKRAIFLTTDFALAVQAAQLASQQLAKLGLEVEIKRIPDHIASTEYLEKLTAPGAEWDIALVLWTPNIPSAYAYLHLLVESQQLGGETLTRVRSKLLRTALQRAVRLPQGRERNQAYAAIDAMLARDVAPVAPLNVVNEATLVSDRVAPRCVVLRPVLDLAVACLK
jgi:peptide/nickel transport system substrate-binding protein